MALFSSEIDLSKIAEFIPSITKILVFGTAAHFASRKLPAIIDTVRDVLHALFTLNAKYQALLKRANSAPGIPVANPTSPYWLDDPPFPDLVDRQDDIPEQADVVIIGSGIAGVSAAKSILELWSGSSSSSSSSSSKSSNATSEDGDSNDDEYVDGGNPRPPLVVVLEARQICSGATGRNGGHIKSAPYEVYSDMRRKLGHERASAIVRFQMQHLPCLVELGKQFPMAEAREVETVDLFLEEKDLDEAEQQVKDAMMAVPEYTAEVSRGDEARKKFDANAYVSGAISFKAGAIWPYRLVTSVWNHLVKTYPNLLISTSTPVHDIEATSSATHPYEVKSSRGTIKARHVLHATNGFAPQLVPALRGRLTGALAHMSAQRPGPSFPAYHGDRSWSVIYAPGFDYITQRPDGADGTFGDLMVGGGFFRSKDEGMDQVGVWDDSRIDALPMMHVRACMPGVFDPKWGIGGGMLKSWSGILGMTGDRMPFVGRLQDKWTTVAAGKKSGEVSTKKVEGDLSADPSQWIAAGFCGEGMVWAWLSGTAVGIMIAGREGEELKAVPGRPGGKLEEWFPKYELAVDEERLKRADLKNLLRDVN